MMASNNDDRVDTSTPVPTLQQMVLAEVQHLVSISKDYQHKIETAKTKVKKTLYTKKLRKNNKQLAAMLVRLEHVNAKGDTSGE